MNKTMIYCSKCKVMGVPLMRSSLRKTDTGITQYSRCRDCNSTLQKDKYHSDPKRYARYVYKSINKHPQKQAARAKVAHAVKTGKLIKPKHCEECGGTKPRIEGAHIDYERPLDVKWLCTPCHRAFDR